MSLNLVDSGRDLANDFNVVIEIPMHADPIKYEVDKETGALFVDRFVSTAMHYPCNYDLPELVLSQITHFFAHYKDLEPGKWVQVEGWGSPEEAKREIADGVKSYRRKAAPGKRRTTK